MKSIFANLKQIPNLTAKLIIAALLVANLFAFSLGSANIFNPQRNSQSAAQTEEFRVIKTGWQLMQWSYSLLRFYKGTPAE